MPGSINKPNTPSGSCQLLSLRLWSKQQLALLSPGPLRVQVHKHHSCQRCRPVERWPSVRWAQAREVTHQQVHLGRTWRSARAHTSVRPTKSNFLCFPLSWQFPWGVLEVERQSRWLGLLSPAQDHSLHTLYKSCRSSFYNPSLAFLQVTLQPTC